MAMSTTIPFEQAAELRRHSGMPLHVCLAALRQSGGSSEAAARLLVLQAQAAELPYGSEFTRALGRHPGYREGYDAAQRHRALGWLVALLREQAHCSRAALAVRAQVDQGALRRLEAGAWGRPGAALDVLERVLPVLGLRLDHRIVALDLAAGGLSSELVEAMNELLQ